MTYAVPAQPAYELQPAMTYAPAYAAPTVIEAQPQAYFTAYEQPQQAALTATALPPLGSQRAGCDWQQQAMMSVPSMVVPAQPGVSFMPTPQQHASAPGPEGSGSAMMAPPPQNDLQPMVAEPERIGTASPAKGSSPKVKKSKKLSSKKTRRDCC